MKKVLVVDDEQGMRELLIFLLKPKGIQVFTANDGVEGLEMFKKDSFDLMFLDIHMPKMNGIEVLKIIRQIKPEQKVIIFSSSSDPDFILENEAIISGTNICLYKPFNIDDVLKIIEENLKI